MDPAFLDKLIFYPNYDKNTHFKIKMTSFMIDEEHRKMLQIINVTKEILLDKYKFET